MATVIQLFNDEDLSLAIGYLDVSDNIPLPITYSVSDVKNVGERTASSSKSIILPGTKNNNQLFGQLFDVNIEFGLATYNIYKKQKCAVISDTRLVMDNAFLQLVSVSKRKNTQTQEDEITYEVIVKSQIFNFFTQIQNRNLEDLDFSEFDHEFTSAQINSAMENTWVDGYKYIMPYTTGVTYNINQLKPSIYAKQYWDKIHQQAGYTYQWDSLIDDFVMFDEMIITSNNTDNKIADYINESYSAKANNTSTVNTFVVTVDVSESSIIDKKINYNVEFDPDNRFNLTLDEWTNPFTYGDIKVVANLNWDIVFTSIATGDTKSWGNSDIKAYFVLFDPLTNTDISVTQIFNKEWEMDDLIVSAGDSIGLRGTNDQLQVTVELNQLPLNQKIMFYIRYDINITIAPNAPSTYNQNFEIYHSIIDSTADINNDETPDISITYNSENIPFGFDYPMNKVIPRKFTQRNFLDGIIKMFNLYVEPDKLNQRNLIYKLRDDFYDEGKVLNWSNKLMLDMDQKVEFLSDLNFKNLVLTYKEDSDDANKTYKDATKEIFGQITTTFDTEWLKNTERIESPFSPTPIGISGWFGYTPYIDYSTNFNTRILIDNGLLQSNFLIIDYIVTLPTPDINFTLITTYAPFTTFDNPFNPNYEINFGQPQFYFYQTRTTENNLYNLNWKRTYQQLNSSRLLTAYFDLNEVDIATLSLADKIWCMNKYWLINAIVDYDANANKPTEVELISYEEAGITLPILG
jgi:hypothetical protein